MQKNRSRTDVPCPCRALRGGIHRKLGVSRRLDLIRLVLSVLERAGLRHRR